LKRRVAKRLFKNQEELVKGIFEGVASF